MIKKVNKTKTWFKTVLGINAATLMTVAPLSVMSCSTNVNYSNDNYFDRPMNWYSPFNSKEGNANAFANDSCSILWDEEQQLFYSWMLFRDGKGFPAGWIEMTSPDLNKWTQGKYRIKQGREFSTINGKGSTSALGGSVWVDTQGRYFEKGDVVFVLSMQPSTILNQDESQEIGKKNSLDSQKSVSHGSNYSSGYETTDESGIAYFVSHGLGKDFYTSGVLSKECLNDDGTMDWRDTALFQVEDELYFAISAHNRLEFWKINYFSDKEKIEDEPKITKVSELYVRNIGVEVPNVVRIDENLWYVSASVQDNPFGGPFQSAWWALCEWDEKQGFIPVKKDENGKYQRMDLDKLQNIEAEKIVQKEQPKNKVLDWENSSQKHLINPWTPNEYGTEGYAQRVVNPYQTQVQELLNSGKKFDSAEIKSKNLLIARSMASNWAYDTDIWSWKGGLFGSEKIEWNEDHSNFEFSPYDKIAGFSDNGTAVYYLKGNDLKNGYVLNFDNKKFIFSLKNKKIVWDNQVNTKLKKWNTQGGPADENDQIIIVWNKCTLTFYNKTKNWNAHFMLPQGTTHEINSGAKSIV
ncbi:hypothetical protein [Spiroplasma floricola]|uniref:Glycosyl hydrolase family 32 N-terminal domain-containing protein n=1 Tax=Spiroplasma floricola 23-6 TaxID=1336749 RepID=A0A2K8SE13_9MOLU|nr:hypothetical protein [Spiroplasma floricola]AUB31704.1 hypothetical protein SFLOR_v1c06540 [Spiroplasma floricola 23-6]